MDKLQNQLVLFLNQKIDLWDMMDELVYTSTVNPAELDEAFTLLRNDESDRGMIASVLFWVIPNSPFRKITDSDNSFFNFLFSIENNDSNFFDQPIIWYLNTNDILVFEKGNLSFFINNHDCEKEIELPEKFKNQTHFCLNCNEEINLFNSIIIPNCSLFIFER